MSPARLVLSPIETSMSIAVSAVVRPAFCLRLLLACLACASCGMALMLAASAQPAFFLSGPGAACASGGACYQAAGAGALAAAAAGLVFAALFLRATGQRGNAIRIDISDVGQIRLAVYLSVAVSQRRSGKRISTATASNPDAGVAMILMAGSTLWPGFLLLQLCQENGQVTSLPVWPGSVAGGAFRPLSVACRAIAARSIGFE
jgi:toxin CptA